MFSEDREIPPTLSFPDLIFSRRRLWELFLQNRLHESFTESTPGLFLRRFVSGDPTLTSVRLLAPTGPSGLGTDGEGGP